MRKEIVRLLKRLLNEFNFVLDDYFPRGFKYIFYITMLLPYISSAIYKICYYYLGGEAVHMLNLDLYVVNALWVFFIVSMRFSKVIRNAW